VGDTAIPGVYIVCYSLMKQHNFQIYKITWILTRDYHKIKILEIVDESFDIGSFGFWLRSNIEEELTVQKIHFLVD